MIALLWRVCEAAVFCGDGMRVTGGAVDGDGDARAGCWDNLRRIRHNTPMRYASEF